MSLATLLSVLLAVQPQVPSPPVQAVDGVGAPSFTIPRIEETVVVDGRLDEPAWARAARLTGFSEYRAQTGSCRLSPPQAQSCFSDTV